MEVAESKNLMTEGTIWKKIIFFALPLFLGNLFQQLYNTADSLIVGNFLGSNALAAVSSSGNLIFLMVGFFNGIAIGAGVVIARYFGARDIDNMQRAIHTTVAFGLVSSLILTVLGVLLAPQILIWMDTPANVLPQSVTYFRIYFMGSLGLVMYNIFVGILQAVGDSRHPLNYLIISSIINIVLDIVLIVVFHMGVGSAAFATILSQFVSAFLCMNRLLRTKDSYRLSLRKIRFHKDMLALIIRYGLPSGLQNSIQYQRLWGNGNGRMRSLFKNRGVCVFANYQLHHGTDNLCRSEPGGTSIRTYEKGRKIRYAVLHGDCRGDRNCHFSGGTAIDSCL